MITLSCHAVKNILSYLTKLKIKSIRNVILYIFISMKLCPSLLGKNKD